MSLLTDDELFTALEADTQSIADAKADTESWEVIVSMANAIEAAVIAKLASGVPELVDSAKDEHGHCIICGIHPASVQAAIAAARVQALEEAAKAVYAYMLDWLKEEMELIEGDTSLDENGVRDFDSEDVADNDEHPRTIAENYAKSTAFTLMSLERHIRALIGGEK